MVKRIKVAVTGAAGQIGYSLLFRIASGEMFGKDTEIDLQLLELTSALNPLKGVIMELEDCAFPLLRKIAPTDDPKIAFADIDWALLVGSVPRKAGMERKDLLKINADVFIKQGKALNEFANKNCKVLVVGNPCNTNAYIAKTIAKNIPQQNFFAMTMLDQNRACAQIAYKADVAISDIKNLAVWGNHSSTMYPDFYNAKIKEKLLVEILKDEEWLKKDFISIVQKRGSNIIEARGFSSAASAANAIIDTVKKITGKSNQHEFFSLAVSSDGSYGIDEELMFSFPVQSDGSKVKIVKGLAHNQFSKDQIKKTYNELVEEKNAVKALLKK